MVVIDRKSMPSNDNNNDSKLADNNGGKSSNTPRKNGSVIPNNKGSKNNKSDRNGSASNGSINLSTGNLENNKEYKKLKVRLQQSLEQKKKLDNELREIEEKLYVDETQYFTNTFHPSAYGNIVKGFDNFARTTTNNNLRRRSTFIDDDRVFSLSSYTYVKELEKRKKAENGSDSSDNDLEDEPPKRKR